MFIATTHTRCRMSKTVDPEDSEVAIDLISFRSFKKFSDTNMSLKFVLSFD